jgi:hypothetical protein
MNATMFDIRWRAADAPSVPYATIIDRMATRRRYNGGKRGAGVRVRGVHGLASWLCSSEPFRVAMGSASASGPGLVAAAFRDGRDTGVLLKRAGRKRWGLG